MKKHITILLVIFILSFAVFAQTEEEKDESNCPDLSVIGPPSSYSPGETITFTMSLSEDYDESDKAVITWSVENGKIIKGQGTKTITVKQTDYDETITATVDVVIGNCNLSGSETGIIADRPIPVLIDDFGDVKAGDFKARIDAFLADLQNNVSSQGYVINYGTKKQIARREILIRNHFNYRGYDRANIVFVNGGKSKEVLTRLWRVPAGADASTIE